MQISNMGQRVGGLTLACSLSLILAACGGSGDNGGAGSAAAASGVSQQLAVSAFSTGQTYTLVNPNSGKALDIAGGSTADGANVQIWTRNGTGAQQWRLEDNNNGTYSLINPVSGKALDVNRSGTNDGANVQLWSRNGSGAQQWRLNQVSGDVYTLINANSNKALDVFAAATNDGSNVAIWGANGSAAQQWQLVPVGSPPPPPNPPGYHLVWSDEFNGNGIDGGKWSFETNGNGGGNNELQYYTSRPENARVENGHLVIEARKENYSGPDGSRQYTSARLRTLNKGDWTFGRMEARMKLPRGQGMWPAFWMLPTDNKYGNWAASGEIDIMEAVNTSPSDNRVYGTLHYGGGWPANTHTGNSFSPASSVSDNYHTYAVEWEPTAIRWYVDDVLYATQTSWWSAGGAYPAPFDQRFHVLLNLAVGGQWPGNPDGNTSFPQRMEVDFVRVYQK